MRDEIFANQKRLGVIPAGHAAHPVAGRTLRMAAQTASGTRSRTEKKLFAREAEVFAAYTAYTDHEIGRVIQEVEDEGKLDNTLIIYIVGDNGTSAEGTLYGTYNQITAYNGILKTPESPAAAALLRRLGLGQDLSAHGGGLVLGIRYAVQVDQAGGLAFRRDPARHGHLLARPHQGRRRHPHAVPPRHRHRSHHSRSRRHPGARRWSTASSKARSKA